jgi:predicted  nucleic acid-binding Zn-ribbon protein
MRLINWLLGLIDRRIARMRKEISDLVAATQALQQQNAVLVAKVDAEVANSNALKAALNAAIAGQLSDEEKQALAASIASIAATRESLADSAQKLADSATVNAPSN